MARKRYARSKHEEICPWPDGPPSPEEVASRARYVGSAEHKDYASPAGEPELRSDNDTSRCEPRITDFAVVTRVLREAISRRCVGAMFEGDFPRYVWGWMEDRLYEARLINRAQGWYKAWPIEEANRPKDPAKRLDWRR